MDNDGMSPSEVTLRPTDTAASDAQAGEISKNIFKVFFSSLTIGIYVAQHGKFVLANPAFRKLLGCSEEELMATGCLDVVFPDDRDTVREAAVAMLKGDSSAPYEFRYVTKSGEIRWVLETVTSVQYNGEPASLGNFMDITDRKHEEAALHASNEELRALVEELKRREREAALLGEMGDLLQSCQTPEEAYDVVGHHVPKLVGGYAGALFVTRDSRNVVEAVSTWGENPATEQVFAPGDCWALRRGRAHVVSGEGGVLCRHVRPGASSGYVCIPLSAQGEMLGMLHLQRAAASASVACPPESAARLATDVSEHLALALANLRLREALENQAIRDPLTGLFNRRYMEETLERELRRAARGGTSLGVVMLDLDNFKRFNDTFGHEAGNTILREFGRLLASQIRDADIACRYGGEEFMLIIPEAPPEAVVERAEHILQSLKRMHVEHRGQPLATVSVSAGVAAYPGDGATVKDLTHSADQALYEAKKRGRARVVARNTRPSQRL